jgi:hypothetical protein
MRLKTAVVTAVLAGSLAGPSVVEASAANRSHHSVQATSKARSRPADDSAPGADPIGVLQSVISEIEFDASPGNVQALLWDLPGFGPY